MNPEEKEMTEIESMQLITSMINKAKNPGYLLQQKFKKEN